MATNKKSEFACKHCGKTFFKYAPPSTPSFDFCSVTCRNKARALKNIPCPICGTLFKPRILDTRIATEDKRKKYCSPDCVWLASIGIKDNSKSPQEIKQIIIDLYPSKGADYLARKLGISKQSVYAIAYKFGITLTSSTYKDIVHGSAKRNMLENNPMKQDKAKNKLKQYWVDNPEKDKTRQLNLAIGRQKQQKNNPTKLEKLMFEYLSELGVRFSPYHLIKSKFIVDVKIDNLIIQADGEYWHGHPRFEPLTKRQLDQQKRDKAQDKYLTTCGFVVVRVWERDMTRENIKSILIDNGILR